VSFSLGYVATIIFKKIHSSNEFIAPYSTTNNALNVKVYNYTLKDCSALFQKMGDCFIRVSENNCTYISAAVLLTIALFALTCWMVIWQCI